MRTRDKKIHITIGLTLLIGLLFWLPSPFVLRLAAAVLLTAFLPGYLLLYLLRLPVTDKLEEALLAVGLSYGLTILTSLGLLYVVGYLSLAGVVGLLGGLTLVCGVIGLLRPNPPADTAPLNYQDGLLVALPLVVTAFFSFVNLGYADYWGDEMNGLLRALAIIGGDKNVIFEHTKGPVEILLPAVFGLLAGRFDPLTVRFIFALANTLAMGGYALLAGRLFNRRVALVAGLLLALNGFYIAFARMVQYQAVVLLMTVLALLLAYRFYREGEFKFLGLSLFFVAIGLLAHYDMLLVLPPLGYLVWRRYGWRWAVWRSYWLPLSLAGLLLVGVAAVFYAPFLTYTHISNTSSYLTRRIIGGADWPVNNFDELYTFAVMLNSGYSILFIILLGLGVIVADLVNLWHGRNRWLWLAVGVTLILGLTAAMMGRASFWPLLAALLLFGALIGLAPASTERKMVYGWIGASFIGYMFLVDHPRTHLRIIYPGWCMLAGVALTYLLARLQLTSPRRWLMVTTGAILGLLFGLFAYYQYLLYVDTEREYIFTYPAHKNTLYWEDPNFPFGSRRMYGAPHRLGWQMINQLYAQGDLRGDWDSNDDGSNLFWYTLGAPRTSCFPRYYFLTSFQQQDSQTDQRPNLAELGYVELGQVWNRDRRQIQVYEFAPLGRLAGGITWTEPSVYATAITPDDFYAWPYTVSTPQPAHRLNTPAVFRPNPAILPQIAEKYNDSRITQVRDKMTLLGYDLDDTWSKSNGVVMLTLYWQAVEVINLSYKIFVHLDRAGQLVAQADDWPACGAQPTSRWVVGQVVADRHLLRLPSTLPAESYTLRVGLYEPQTGLRLDVLDVAGNPQDTSFPLTQVMLPK